MAVLQNSLTYDHLNEISFEYQIIAVIKHRKIHVLLNVNDR
jgi:hypothetical protein